MTSLQTVTILKFKPVILTYSLLDGERIEIIYITIELLLEISNDKPM